MRHVRLSVAVACVAVLLAVGSPPLLTARQSAALTTRDLAPLTFRTIGPANMSGRFVDMAVVESDPYVFYVASSTGGMYKTTDNGVTFTPVFEREGTHSLGDVEIFQPNPSIVWVGTGERANRQSTSWGDGVYKSTDAGRTWTNVGLKDSHHIGRIVAHPTNPDIVYVAAMGHLWGPNTERGLYKTIDGGRSWQPVLQVDADTGVVDVAMDPSNPEVLYAATYQRRRTAYGFHGGGPGSALHKSTDGGATWRKLTGNGLPAGEYGRIGIAVYAKNPRIVYVSIEQGDKYNASTAYITPKGGVFRSDNGGDTWDFRSTWNPRPMYASQITIDPNDDQRLYMVNTFSVSTDGGRTFTAPPQSLHGDDRLVWVNPRDSRHLIKLDDGGVGISYDRGLKWLYVASLPVSQYYRVAVDQATPFNVYGGLQDNGCWVGPSATYSSSGILNEDWRRLCGGDGFFTVPDPEDGRTVYAASQYLGLARVDLRTGQSQDIRPGDPRGAIGARRNFDVWSDGLPEPEMGNAMHPANWDAPIVVSPHNPRTIYAGMKHLFRSRDRGVTWEDLGRLTTDIDRRGLPIMGFEVADHVPSLDDGVPYWPTISALAESPRVEGLLYAGTDDGQVSVSRDAGKSWTEVSRRLPGLPERSWIAGIEPSSHQDGTVYLTVDNHRSDDFRNYVYRSDDFGRTWTSIAGDLPAGRVARTIREDARNPRLLYLGTEMGLFITLDGGGQWLSFRQNMPTLPINDLVVHRRDQDLVLGTHGRGVWILDDVTALQEWTPDVAARPAHLFSPQPGVQIRYTNQKAHMGDMVFRGQNPPAGGIIDYWLGAEGGDVSLTVHDGAGSRVATITPTRRRGLNRVVWNLRADDLVVPVAGGRSRLQGTWVPAGEYTVRLMAGGVTSEKRMTVRDDPRIDVSPADRQAWSAMLTEIAGVYRRAVLAAAAITERAVAGAEERRLAGLLPGRISGLYQEVGRFAGRPTEDQRSELRYYLEVTARLEQAGRRYP